MLEKKNSISNIKISYRKTFFLCEISIIKADKGEAVVLTEEEKAVFEREYEPRFVMLYKDCKFENCKILIKVINLRIVANPYYVRSIVA